MIHNQMVEIVRTLVETITFAGIGCEIDHYRELAERPLDDVLDDLRHGRTATMCGGAAAIARVNARAIGIECIAVNFGQDGSQNTHVLNFAKLENGEYSLYCPTFGLTIVDAALQRPATVGIITDCLKYRDFRRLRVIRLTRRPKRIIVKAIHDESCLLSYQRLPDGRFDCRIDATRNALLAAREAELWLKTRFDKPSIFDFLRYPISHSGERDADDISKRFLLLPPFAQRQAESETLNPIRQAIDIIKKAPFFRKK